MNLSLKKIWRQSVLIGIFVIVGGVDSRADGVTVIANDKLPISSIAKSSLSDIFLGEQSQWSDGSKIAFVIFNNDAVQEEFFSNYVGRSKSQFNAYWKKKVFSGQAMSPTSFDSEAEVVNFVKSNPGAIGFVSSAASGLEAVKKIQVSE